MSVQTFLVRTQDTYEALFELVEALDASSHMPRALAVDKAIDNARRNLSGWEPS